MISTAGHAMEKYSEGHLFQMFFVFFLFFGEPMKSFVSADVMSRATESHQFIATTSNFVYSTPQWIPEQWTQGKHTAWLFGQDAEPGQSC